MVKAQILTGTRAEIAESLARIEGEFHEVIVFVEQPAQTSPEPADLFAEMDAFMATADDVGDARSPGTSKDLLDGPGF